MLQFIHDKRVIHRDIKPENIIRRQSDNKLVLIDFGIAKLLIDSAILRPATLIGSQNYLGPEQLCGKVFPASDL
ncbi:protein kinase domain-containing protein [Microcoleus sp. OTE_8_concoct_300]|uniref:protein kinase domain-containing protein n=1 Tax=Microcoleus sp. OTE_8_concoct_300 TaxID=2964710 RepID=UPI00403EFD4B